MKLPQVATQAVGHATDTMVGIKRFAKLERVLASVCALTPLLLILTDDGPDPIRKSISAYYDMGQNQFFYVPLTMAGMMFIVNGLVKERRAYNWLLGVMLVGLVLANKQDAKVAHYIFATAFFVGNAVVMVWFSPKKERWFKVLLVVLIALTMLACWQFDGFTLFWAEWISLGIIAFHYVLESLGVIE